MRGWSLRTALAGSVRQCARIAAAPLPVPVPVPLPVPILVLVLVLDGRFGAVGMNILLPVLLLVLLLARLLLLGRVGVSPCPFSHLAGAALAAAGLHHHRRGLQECVVFEGLQLLL